MILGAKVLEMLLNLPGIMKMQKLKLVEMSKHKVQQPQLQ